MFSIQNKNFNITKLLLKYGANVNHKDIDGFTPLTIGVDTKSLEIVKLLLLYKPIIEVMFRYNLESRRIIRNTTI